MKLRTTIARTGNNTGVVVPEDVVAALAAAPAAAAAFERLSYSNQRRHVLAIEGAKAAETRQRRIAKIVAELAG